MKSLYRSSKKSKSQNSARLEAAQRLDVLEERDGYIGLGNQSGSSSAVNERHTRDLVSGVTRRRRYLDFLIQTYYKGKADSMEQRLKTVLRMGMYELLFTSTPDHAALNEAVELARDYVREGAASLANGILRTVLRNKDNLPVPAETPLETYLGIMYSHPDWMVKRWLGTVGKDATLKMLERNNERPVFGVHIVSGRDRVLEALEKANVAVTASELVPDFIRISSIQPLFRGGFFKDGSVRVQDEAAALVVHAMSPAREDSILDMCAAPGGKALYAALLMAETGKVVAADIHSKRLHLLDKNMELFDVSNLDMEEMDGTRPPDKWGEAFDKVLVDAPCTGLGVLSKRADMRWHREESDLKDLIQLQIRLLDGAAACVKPGGLLVYSTCTTEREENMGQVEAFLERHADFRLEPAPDIIPAGLIDAQGNYESRPYESDMDGAFAARLRKN